jgi:hypothetical protein
MINTKATLKKLHSKFPLLTLDDLFEILDCYVEENCLWTKDITWSSEPKPETILKPSPYITTVSSNSDISSNKITAVHYTDDGGLKAN